MVVGVEDVRNLKPHPEGVRLIIQKMAFNPTNAVIIGDRPEDILAGQAAGVKTGAVKWGLGKWDELLSLNPEYEFLSYRDLLYF